MKFPLLPLFLLALSSAIAADGVFVPTRPPVSDNTLLSAIAQVETGNNPKKVGRYGERTRLQILPETWRRFSRLPQSYHNRAETDRVARAYLDLIRHRLDVRGLPQTPFYIAASWNAGPGWKHLSRGTISYAQRVSNLVEAEEAANAGPRAMVATAPAAPAPAVTLAAATVSNAPATRSVSAPQTPPSGLTLAASDSATPMTPPSLVPVIRIAAAD